MTFTNDTHKTLLLNLAPSVTPVSYSDCMLNERARKHTFLTNERRAQNIIPDD